MHLEVGQDPTELLSDGRKELGNGPGEGRRLPRSALVGHVPLAPPVTDTVEAYPGYLLAHVLGVDHHVTTPGEHSQPGCKVDSVVKTRKRPGLSPV